MKVVAVIQARTGSTRLPGKVLLPLAGRPVLERMLERVARARELDAVIVATTREAADDSVASLCHALGVPCYRGSSQDLLDRHLCAARLLAADAIVKVPSDCPLIDPRIIDHVVSEWRLQEGALDFLSNLHPPTHPDGNDVEVMSMATLVAAHAEARRPFEREHTTPFIWDQPERFRVANVVWGQGRNAAATHRVVLDYPEDYEVIARVFEALYRPHQATFGVNEIVAFLDAHPEVAASNARHRGAHWYRNHLTELRTLSPRGADRLSSELGR